MIVQIRQAGESSDLIVRRLLARGQTDPFAAALVVASLVRLGLRRCRGDRDRLAALVSELAIVVGEAWAGAIPESDRRLAHVLVDRAWGRVRAIERKGRWVRAVDLDAVADALPASAPGPEHVVVSRVAFEEFRGVLASGRTRGDVVDRGPVLRAWNTVADLMDRPAWSQQERNQWRYARQVLRRRVSPDLELVGDDVV
jgi:hypothetical protein